MANRKKTIKDIVEMKRENERLQQIINHLKIENSDYALKCNRIENIIAKIEGVVKDNPAKLVEASGNVCSILQTCISSRTVAQQPLPVVNETLAERRNSVKPRQSLSKTRPNNKAHIKPHMVNGHILYVPTINLTRVSDSHTRTQMDVDANPTENEALEETSNEDGGDQSSSDAEESGADNVNEESSNNNIHNEDEDMSEPSSSQSPSHSTLLSGTFKEVKIYLNPVTPEVVDKTRKAKNKSPRTRLSNAGRITRSKRS